MTSNHFLHMIILYIIIKLDTNSKIILFTNAVVGYYTMFAYFEEFGKLNITEDTLDEKYWN